MFLPYQKNMVNGIDPCLLQIAQISHDAWCCFDTSPNDNVSSPLRGVSSGGRITVSSQLGSFTLRREIVDKTPGWKKNTWQPREKNGWGIQKMATNSKTTSMPNLRKHGNSQHLEVPTNRDTSSWQNDTLILLDPLNDWKWQQPRDSSEYFEDTPNPRDVDLDLKSMAHWTTSNRYSDDYPDKLKVSRFQWNMLSSLIILGIHQNLLGCTRHYCNKIDLNIDIIL